MNKVYNILYRFQPYLLGAAFFLLLLSVAVKFDKSSMELIWRERPHLAILLVALGLACVLLYIQVDKANLMRLSRQIKDQNVVGKSGYPDLLRQLTNRQREVYQLIVEGKSNKEIRSELFIEASTLKTHINQIYKKLGIKNRRALRQQHEEKIVWKRLEK